MTADARKYLVEQKIEDIWKRFKSTGDKQDRDSLILYYSPLVKFVAYRVAATLPKNIELSDLIGYGVFGLLDAINKFDLEKNVKFETYAMTRVRGAIIDALRAIDWVPRSVRAKMKDLDECFSKLAIKLNRTPTDEELANSMGVSVSDLHSIYRRISVAGVVALDDVLQGEENQGSQISIGDLIPSNYMSPTNSLEDNESKKMLEDAISKLSEREQAVLKLYYFEYMNLSQIGEILGVTESRACQIHAKAILALRAALGSFWKD